MAWDCFCLICCKCNQMVALCFAELPKAALSDWKAPGSTGCLQGTQPEGHAGSRDFAVGLCSSNCYFCAPKVSPPGTGEENDAWNLWVTIQMTARLCKSLSRSFEMRPSSVVWLYESHKQQVGAGSLERQRGKPLQERLHRHLDRNTARRRRCRLQMWPMETLVSRGTGYPAVTRVQKHPQAAQTGAHRPPGGPRGCRAQAAAAARGSAPWGGAQRGPFHGLFAQIRYF